jgi:hypothetical protein
MGQVLGVLTHERSRDTINAVLATLEIPLGLDWVWEAVAWNDTLAYAVARLALLLDPEPLPAIGDEAASWATYVKNWRPGVPRLETWAERYTAAVALFPTRVVA